jgi:hypothetical protein
VSFSKNSPNIAGKHALLSPSAYHWLDYDEDKLRRVFFQQQQTRRGNDLHDYAQRAITLGIRQADNGSTLSSYINDCIGFRMTPEFPLYYSDVCFGTSDAVGFSSKLVLRVADLKTGITETSMKQPMIYAAIFCLQFEYSPLDLSEINLRIYQNNEIRELIADPVDILMTMDKIKAASDYVEFLREEAED